MLRESQSAQVDDAALLDDWLGLAGYLAEAVHAGDVTVDTARAELAAAVTGAAERRTLAQAADLATTQLGPESLVASLLQWSTEQAPPEAEVA
jgi:uncharacterized membrane protein (DUF4010 family)